mgnify:CR=1 FL=1
MAIHSVLNSYTSIFSYMGKPAQQVNSTGAETAATAMKALREASSVHISDEARRLYEQSHNASAAAGEAEFDTNKGAMGLDIDAYFTPPGSQGVDLDSVPLLMPTRKNIDALSRHISASMPAFLARNGIAEAPASVTYDNRGQIQLPAAKGAKFTDFLLRVQQQCPVVVDQVL